MMEAATSAPRELSSDKAQRIIQAMRSSVARRGAAGSTFDHVAREAGVSRGLLHYYFGTKERLLVEVVRQDCELRMAVLDAALTGAGTVDDFLDVLVRSLEDTIENDPEFYALFFELITLAHRNEEIAASLTELFRRSCERVAAQLQRKQEEGVLSLAEEPDAVASALFALGDGTALRMMFDPTQDLSAHIRAGVRAARALLLEG
jgi:AcrR family transcriptional regulator